MTQPIQPLYEDANGIIRFRENSVVRYLLDWASAHGQGMNELYQLDFPQKDREQFAQLIGYSLSGFEELSYVSADTCEIAEQMYKTGVPEDQAAAVYHEAELVALREALREPISRLYGVHPEDLGVKP